MLILKHPKKANTKLIGHDLLYWTKKLLRLSKDGLEKEILSIRMVKMKLYS